MNKRKIEFGEGILPQALDALGDYIMVTMEEPWELLKDDIANPPRETILNRDMGIENLESLEIMKRPKVDHIVGFGGGTSCDTAKYFSWKWNIPLIVSPSIISVDAWLCRSIAIRMDHKVRYIGDVAADRIIVDYSIIRKAPAFLNRAGLADVISIATALGDWLIARDSFGTPFDQKVFDRAKKIAKDLMNHAADIRDVSNEGVKALVDGLVSEVELCEEWGNARPEEGGEHFLAYNLEDITHSHYIHGCLIALNILVVLKLQRDKAVFSWQEMKDFFDAIELDYQPQKQDIGKEAYRKALSTMKEYIKKENLFPGLWSLDNIFDKTGIYSVDGILEWAYSL
jgi:glycerol dehydrogenase-like iron-containing ADH family enzyme